VFGWRGVALFCPAWLQTAGGRAGSGIEESDVNARKERGDAMRCVRVEKDLVELIL